MSFRFRRSKKIAPGVRINVSKKSVGLSIGGKGFRHSINSSGRRTTTAGIPGTGLSYSKSHSTKKASNDKNTNATNTVHTPSTSSQLVSDYLQQIKALKELHLKKISPVDWEEKVKEDPPFHIGEMGPNEKKASEQLKKYKPSLLSRLLRRERKEVEQLERKIEHAIVDDKKKYADWLDRVKHAQRMLGGGEEVYQELFTETETFQLANEFGVRLEFRVLDKHEVEVIFVMNDEVIPNESLSLTKTGKISKKALTKSNYYQLYQQYICSFLLKAVQDCLTMLPNVHKVHCYVQEQGIDSADGHYKQFQLIEVTFTRDKVDVLRFETLEPVAAVEGFNPTWKFLKTKGFQPISS